MAEYLVIRMSDDPAAPAEWIAVDSSGARRSAPASGTLDEARAEIGNREVIVLVPSADVLTTSVDLPVNSRAKLQQTLPFALEEYLADDVENLHFAAGTRRSSGRIPAAVVNRSKMDEWCDRLDAAEIEAASMVADIHGLARIPGTISMLVAENQIVVNDGADIELVMQDVSPGDALAAIGALDDGSEAEEDAPQLPRHVLVYCGEEEEQRYRGDWIALRHELDSLDVKVLADGVMPRLAVTVATGAGIDLLQGDYGAQLDYASMFRPWRLAAVLLVALGATAIIAKAANYYVLKNELDELQQQFIAEVSKVQPGTNNVPDPVRFVGSLRNRIGQPDAPPLFLQSMQGLSRAAAQQSDIDIDVITYRSGVVNIRLTAPDVSTLDNIQQIVSESGEFLTNIQSTERQEDSVTGQLQIEARGQ